MKSVIRSAKNFTKGYSDVQIKVREATSNDEHGPNLSQLEEISRSSFNPTQLSDIIYIIDKRLNDHGKNWRHVYKTLVLLEYCICCGSDSIVSYAKERVHEIRTLREFISIDDHGNDNGACVREKSKDIVTLLTDDNVLEEARRNRNPPLQRRPSSTGPITINPPTRNDLSIKSANRLENLSYPGRGNSIQHRRSFEDLQNIDEEAAMRMALEESKAEFEGQKNARDSRDSFPVFMENVSRSSSAKSSSFNLRETEKIVDPKSLTAEQLLDLDDESFANALDKTFSGGRVRDQLDSIDIFNNNTTTKFTNGNLNDQASLMNPFENNIPQISVMDTHSSVDPFADTLPNATIATATTSTPATNALESNLKQTNQPQINVHPIAIPAPLHSDLQIGAKPVLPGNMAPQFSSNPKVESNQPSEKDPFADLL